MRVEHRQIIEIKDFRVGSCKNLELREFEILCSGQKLLEFGTLCNSECAVFSQQALLGPSLLSARQQGFKKSSGSKKEIESREKRKKGHRKNSAIGRVSQLKENSVVKRDKKGQSSP